MDLNEWGLAKPPAKLGIDLAAHLAASKLLATHGMQDTGSHLRVDDAGRLTLPTGLVNSYVAAVLADALRRELLAQGATFTFETVMSSPDKIDFMREAQAAGYRTYLYFVATDDPAINVARVQQRVKQGGHPVPENKIRERYARSIALLDEACAAASRAYIFDNSGDAHEWIAEISGGDELTLRTDALPDWFANTSLWRSFSSAPASQPQGAPSGAD